MLKKIKQNLLKNLAAVFALGLLALPVFALQTVSAQVTQSPLCQGAVDTTTAFQGRNAPATNCISETADADAQFNNIIAQVINIFSIIVGVIAVIMIIYGGFRYITSGGDSGKVGDAKNTILYAIIGLVLVALAQFVVKFVLNRASAT